MTRRVLQLRLYSQRKHRCNNGAMILCTMCYRRAQFLFQPTEKSSTILNKSIKITLIARVTESLNSCFCFGICVQSARDKNRGLCVCSRFVFSRDLFARLSVISFVFIYCLLAYTWSSWYEINLFHIHVCVCVYETWFSSVLVRCLNRECGCVHLTKILHSSSRSRKHVSTQTHTDTHDSKPQTRGSAFPQPVRSESHILERWHF